MLRALRGGTFVGVMNEQYAGRSGSVLAPLFGVRAPTSAGLATLSLRSGAPIIPCYIHRVGSDRHRAHFLPPVQLQDTGNRAADIAAGTAACNAALEEMIRAHPEEWMWSHRRFRRSPDLPERMYG